MRSVTKVNRARVPVHALKTESWDKPRLGQKTSTAAVAETVAGPCLDGFVRASTPKSSAPYFPITYNLVLRGARWL